MLLINDRPVTNVQYTLFFLAAVVIIPLFICLLIIELPFELLIAITTFSGLTPRLWHRIRDEINCYAARFTIWFCGKYRIRRVKSQRKVTIHME